ncbi:MAG: aldehyde ferredoxin oxidoreductase family protein [Bacillota bacterium]
MRGYAGRMLRVDLANRKTHEEELDPALARKFIGGRGLGTAILFQELKRGIDPFSPDNKLVFAVGPFEGAPLPGASRLAVTGKSPLTGLLTDTDFGGYFPLEMKRAGYDAIIVEGKADRPVYLWVNEDKVEIRDATVLWVTSTLDTQRAIHAEIGEGRARVVTVGPAAEKLVRYACIASEARYFGGRSGLGAVMGSKNLKAIAIRGYRGGARVAEPERLKALARDLIRDIRTDGTCDSLSRYGTWNTTAPANMNGIIPTKNFQLATFSEISKIDGDAMLSTIYAGHRTCPWCPVACRRVVRATAPYSVSPELGGPQYETVASFGSLLLNANPAVIAKANELCNLYGLDTISAGVCIGFAMECYEKGVLSDHDIGFKPVWGEAKAILQLLELIAMRRGVGDLLAEGVRRAAMKIGQGSEAWAMHVKGLELPMHDPRGKKGQAISYATSIKGADHMESMHDEAFQRENAMPALGFISPMPRTSWDGKAKLVKTMQDYWGAMADSLAVCKFLLIPPRPFKPERIINALNLVTGWDMTIGDLLRAGERVYNLGRAFAIQEFRGANGCITEPRTAGQACREGAGRPGEADLPARLGDALPARFTEAVTEGGSAGERIDPEEFGDALREYYQLRGWTKDGIPTDEKLEELNLAEMVGEL